MARRWMVWSTPGRRLLYLCRVWSATPWGVIVSQVGQEVWHVYVGGLVYFWAGSALLLTGLVECLFAGLLYSRAVSALLFWAVSPV